MSSRIYGTAAKKKNDQGISAKYFSVINLRGQERHWELFKDFWRPYLSRATLVFTLFNILVPFRAGNQEFTLIHAKMLFIHIWLIPLKSWPKTVSRRMKNISMFC